MEGEREETEGEKVNVGEKGIEGERRDIGERERR